MKPMFDQPLLIVNPLALMQLWGDLVECYHGVHSFGGDTAEIHAYRVNRAMPGRVLSLEETQIEINILCAKAIMALCEEFSKRYDCRITIDDMKPSKWLLIRGEKFQDSCHIRVVAK